ncbi:MAG: hypothetical protein K940chlam2_00748 [Chlamydiae bacterium]|nr:hypothetical protein [Chlamydiota bacterium]
MRYLFLFLLFSTTSVFALRIDPSTSSFEQREKKYIDTFDFSGSYEKLENIDIDARRKKRVELLLTGEYPALESINYEGSFGSLSGKLLGSFPELSKVVFACSSATMDLDLSGEWKQDCEINIASPKGEIVLTLPKNVGIIVHAKRQPLGTILVEGLQKKGMGWMNKTYINSEYGENPITLTLNLVVTEGKIVLR